VTAGLAGGSDDPPVGIVSEETLSDNWGRLSRVVFDLRGRDGRVERQTREVYDRGHGVALLPHDPERGTVLLVRQFRIPAYMAGHNGMLVEACAGMCDGNTPEDAIRKEAEEELGLKVRRLTRLFEAFMSPGSVSEKLTFFLADYRPEDRSAPGGGAEGEGEDIEILETTLDEAFAMIGTGEIADAKTIMLLQHARLRYLAGS